MRKESGLRVIVLAAMLASSAGGLAQAHPTATQGIAPVYSGAPNLPVAMAFIVAGGNAGGFSSIRALNAIVGAEVVQAELQNLATQYGDANRDQFVQTFDFAINDAWKRAGQANLRMPPAADETGHVLAIELIRAGTAPDGAFWTSYFFDRTLSHRVTTGVMSDIDASLGPGAAANFVRMSNQFFYDLSQRIGAGVALAPVH